MAVVAVAASSDQNDPLVSLELAPSYQGWVYLPIWNAPRPIKQVLSAHLDLSPDSTSSNPISLSNVFEQFPDPAPAVDCLFQVQEQWRPIAESIFERAWHHRLLHRAEKIFAHSIARNAFQLVQALNLVRRLSKQHQQSLQAGQLSPVWPQVVKARRRLHWLWIRQQWLEMWSEMDDEFRKTLRRQETIRAKRNHWDALIKADELYQVSNLLYEALKDWPDHLVPNPSKVLSVWYVLMLSECGASNEDLNHRLRRDDGSLRSWSKIVQDKCGYEKRKVNRRSGSL